MTSDLIELDSKSLRSRLVLVGAILAAVVFASFWQSVVLSSALRVATSMKEWASDSLQVRLTRCLLPIPTWPPPASHCAVLAEADILQPTLDYSKDDVSKGMQVR